MLPREQLAWQRFLDVIRAGFERFGFVPIETPVFERTDVLFAGGSDAQSKQVYFVQSSGSLERARPELALRFDLTVPLARYVARYEPQLTFPFKRYQMQKVYRGERPQRGRYREFLQCDVDVIGRERLPLGFDAEVIAVADTVLRALRAGPFTIRLSNRKVLEGLLLGLGVPAEAIAPVLRQLDKLRKIGAKAVKTALLRPPIGLADVVAGRLIDVIEREDSNDVVLRRLERTPGVTPDLAELREVLEGAAGFGVTPRIDLGVVRGLGYYTGTVYEASLGEGGSVCGGGRYDDLASRYTRSKLPGVGLSIGATRLFAQLRDLGLLEGPPGSCDVFIGALDAGGLAGGRALAMELRSVGVRTDLAPEPATLARLLRSAVRAGARFAVSVAEVRPGIVTVRELATRCDRELPRPKAAADLARMVSG